MSADAKQGAKNGEAEVGLASAMPAEAHPMGASSGDSSGARTKRAYQKPSLRRLGSVRELTLGGTRGMTEGAGSFRTM
ncbi:MAG: hypothetical protein JWP97_1897 [Labilithrix sp.]|nr:hypothetical protein [Labilithrix sp.]